MAENSKRQTILAAVAVVALVAAVAIAMRGGSSAPKPSGAYFYDLAAGQLVVLKPGEKPASDQVVAAAVFSCASCDDAASRFVGYLTRESDELKKALASGEPPTAEQMQNGQLIRAVDGDKWVSASSPEGMALANAPMSKCASSQTATLCRP